MTMSPEELREAVRSTALECGAVKVGFARCEPVEDDAWSAYERFVGEGRHGAMGYMANHMEIRRDPALLLEGAEAQAIVVCAFPYFTAGEEPETDARFALYARGKDYHHVLKSRLSAVTALLESAGYASRVCVDSAPLMERYWAVKAGVGFRGVNSQLIVDGAGSYVFLGSIVTSAPLEPDAPCTERCKGCGMCVKACPTGAIGADGSFDARKCLSYLTIEYRGELPDRLPLGKRVYGCDSCQLCCPHNVDAKPTSIDEFHPDEEIVALTRAQIASLTRPEFAALFARSAVKRLRLDGLKRNAAYGARKVD